MADDIYCKHSLIRWAPSSLLGTSMFPSPKLREFVLR
jgi:hypothetical protein